MELIKQIQALKEKALAIMISSIATVSHMDAKNVKIVELNNDLKKTDEENFKILKPKLVLKLNFSPDGLHRASMHTSHRSHSSHSSHSSHYSSSYSGSSRSSYTPSYTPPPSTVYRPAASTPKTSYTPATIYKNSSTGKNSSSKAKKTGSNNYSSSITTSGYSNNYSTIDSYYLGSRVLYKGLEGNDVEELQKKLKGLGYEVIVSTYFGEKTEQAVIKFQKNNELKPDGRVGSKTIEIINSKL